MQNYPNPCLSPEKFVQENSWEYYFEQPLKIGSEQAYAGDNVSLSEDGLKIFLHWWGMYYFENRDNVLTEWRMLVKLGLLKIKPALTRRNFARAEKSSIKCRSGTATKFFS